MDTNKCQKFLDELKPFPNISLLQLGYNKESKEISTDINNFFSSTEPDKMSRKISETLDKEVTVSNEYKEAYNASYQNLQTRLKSISPVKLLICPIIGIIVIILGGFLINELTYDTTGPMFIGLLTGLIILFTVIMLIWFKHITNYMKIKKDLSFYNYPRIMCNELAKTFNENGCDFITTNMLLTIFGLTENQIKQKQIDNHIKDEEAKKKRSKLIVAEFLVSLLFVAIILCIVFRETVLPWILDNIVYPVLGFIILIAILIALFKPDNAPRNPSRFKQMRQQNQSEQYKNFQQVSEQKAFYKNGGFDRVGSIDGLGSIELSSNGGINRIGSYEVFYSANGTINRIGPYEVTYSGDEITRIGNLNVYYSNGIPIKVGDSSVRDNEGNK